MRSKIAKNKPSQKQIASPAPPAGIGPLWNKQECAAFLRMKTRTLEKYVALGRIPVIRLSQKMLLFNPPDVLAAINN